MWSPDGNDIAFNYWDPVHDTRVAVYDLRTGAVQVVTDHPGPDAAGNHTEDFDPGWTPDGRVAFRRGVYDSQEQHHTLMTVGVDGTGLQALPVGGQDGYPVSCSPDGWVLYMDGEDALHIASLDGDEIDFTSPTPPADDSQPAWSPDERSIVYVHSGLEKGVHVLQLQIHDLEATPTARSSPAATRRPPGSPASPVTVSCTTPPVACLRPGDPPGLDPQPLCAQAQLQTPHRSGRP